MTGLRRLALLAAVLVACVLVALVSRTVSQRTGPVAEGVVQERPATSERTEDGAVAAAHEVLRVFGSTRMYDSRERERVLPSLAGQTGAAAEVDRGFALAARTLGLDERGRSLDGELVSRLVPVGHRTISLDADRAEIAFWVVGLLGVAGETSPVPVMATWTTETLTLEWVDGRWVLTSMRQADGPAPIGSAQVPAPAADIARAARDFEEVLHGR